MRDKITFTHRCEAVIPISLEDFLEHKKKWTVVIIKDKNEYGHDEKHQLNYGSFEAISDFGSGICGNVKWVGFSLYKGHWMNSKPVYTEDFKEPFIVYHSDKIIIDISAARLMDSDVTIGKLLSGKTIHRSIFAD